MAIGGLGIKSRCFSKQILAEWAEGDDVDLGLSRFDEIRVDSEQLLADSDHDGAELGQV